MCESLSLGFRMVGIKIKVIGFYVYCEYWNFFGFFKLISLKCRGICYYWLWFKRMGSCVRIYSFKIGFYWKLELSIMMFLLNIVFVGFMMESLNISMIIMVEFCNIYMSGGCSGFSLVEIIVDE